MTQKGKFLAQSPRGMRDILPHEQALWTRVRKATVEVAEYYNFERIDTPLLERAEIFERSIGERTEIVEKQMYMVSASGERLALRPEGTAGVARAYVEHGLAYAGSPLKLYYEGPMFRHESPQAGRLRELRQFGLEIISHENDPLYDAQIALSSMRILEALKIKDATVRINSIGCRVCRPVFVRRLKEYYRNKTKTLCADCRRRLQKNPLRILDCKTEECAPLKTGAPDAVDSLCVTCKNHFKAVLEFFDELNLPYSLDPTLVRGLDYYSKTVFELFTEGGTSALGGGGRYDYLIETLGGRSAPAVGAALGLDRIVEFLAAQGGNGLALRQKPKIYLIHIGAFAKRKGLSIVETLRRAGIPSAESLGKDSLAAQLKAADKARAPLALIFGQREAHEENIIIRDMRTGGQETVPLAKMIAAIKRKLR